MPENRMTVAVAESCTGGLLAAEIVATPGSGDWFVGGVVAYHATVKYQLLGVPEGPVISAEAAVAMARGVKALLETAVGIAITGVAGPDTEEDQPVGTVFIGVSTPDGSHAVPLVIEGAPERVRSVAVDRALEELGDVTAVVEMQAGSGT